MIQIHENMIFAGLADHHMEALNVTSIAKNMAYVIKRRLKQPLQDRWFSATTWESFYEVIEDEFDVSLEKIGMQILAVLSYRNSESSLLLQVR